MLRTILIIAAIFLFTEKSFSQTEKIKNYELKGYIKDLQSIFFVDNPDSIITSNLIHNRINFKWDISKSFYTRIELRNRIFYGEQVKLIPGFGKFIDTDNGYINLSKLWVNEGALVIHSAIDRALLNYSSSKMNVAAGRQRINWGINTIWNPNDLFNAYSFLDFDYEERPGVDAIRMQYFVKTFSSAEFAFKPSKEKNQSVAAALYKFNKWKYDFQFLTGIYYDDLAFGAGWAGNIKDAGFKGEATYFRSKNNFADDNGTLSASAALDYSFKNNWYVSAAMLYQSEPAAVIQGNSPFITSNLSAKTLMPYRYTFYLGAMKGFTPIISANMAIIYSPTDNSTILFPSFAYNVAQNLDLDLVLQSFFSETFGTYRAQGNSIYLRMKFSF
jgi:hypothetical protein